MKFEVNKTYKLRSRQEAEARWFLFTPKSWLDKQNAWLGKSATDHDLIFFAKEINEFDVVEVFENAQPRCDCGALKARTTHAGWCSLQVVAS